METALQNALSGGSLLALLVAFAAGLLSVITPCVLPMVTITLGTIGVTKTSSRGQALLKSACYLAGITVTFTALGLFFGLTGQVFGSLVSHPAVCFGIAAVFILLAAGSFELYEPRLPDFIAQRLYRAGGRGWLGALLAGLVAGFIAVPCIGPVLAGILTFVATERDAVWGALLLTSYALGFGLPFFLVGVFALRLPKSGPWVRGVKSVFGIALLLGAFWFLRSAFPALQEAAALWPGLGLIAAGVLAGAIHRHFDGSRTDKLRKTAGILLAVLGGILTMNHLLFVPELDWCHESPEQVCLTQTCGSAELTVAVFSAEWCPYCKQLEKETLTDPRVRRALAGFGRVFVDTDANRRLSREHGITGIPAMLFFGPGCRPLPDRVVGFVTPDELLEFLDKIER